MKNVDTIVIRDSPIHVDIGEESTDGFESSEEVNDVSSEPSDSDGSINSSVTNDDEKALSKLIQSVLNGKIPVASSSNWPSVLLVINLFITSCIH